MPRVDSEAIRSIDYDARSRRLVVTFTSGGTYRYEMVPPSVHRDLMAAESHGRFFHAHIRDRYPYRRIE